MTEGQAKGLALRQTVYVCYANDSGTYEIVEEKAYERGRHSIQTGGSEARRVGRPIEIVHLSELEACQYAVNCIQSRIDRLLVDRSKWETRVTNLMMGVESK